MALRQESVIEAAKLLADQAPALSDALEQVMTVMRQQPMTVADRRDLDTRLLGIGEAWMGVRDAMQRMAVLAASAAEEQKATTRENAELKTRVAALEADLRAWHNEYEPDSHPDRPAFFSNIRHALSVFRH